MTSILFSRDWYRLSHLKPQMRPHVEVHVHNYRGERWYMLQNHSTGHFRRLSPQAYFLVGLMDGVRTVETIWQLASERLREELPTHEELLQLISSLYQANLIRMDLSGDAAELFRQKEEQKNKRWLGKLRSPLSVQIPLLDPNAFLERTQAWVRPLFTPAFVALWVSMIVMLAVLGWRHWDELTSNVSDRVLAADNLLLLWFAYPLIKILHELGHAYVVKRSGGNVHEVGVMLLVFFPMPYVDASASTGFANKYRRMLVDAVGMMVELFIAAIAMLVWVNAEEGLVRSFAFNILFIAGVSTLLFNGNPLLRFDGYYLLSDWLEMPNLGQRANQFWSFLNKRFVFGVKQEESPARDIKESLLFAFYGAGSLVYRLFISISIVLFVAKQYFFVGVILAIWSVCMVWIWPFIKQLWSLLHDQEILQKGYSPGLVLIVLSGIIGALLFVVPIPQTTTVEGVVMTEEDNRLVVDEGCFFSDWVSLPGDTISRGDIIFDCSNQSLSTELEVSQWQLQEVIARQRGAFDDPVQLNILNEEMDELTRSIDELTVRLERMTVKSKVDGILIVPYDHDMAQKWLQRGEQLGYVVNEAQLKINVMLPENRIELFDDNVRQVAVRSVSDSSVEMPVNDWVIFPSSSRALVSPVLSEQGGGVIALEPGREDVAIENYFQIEAKVKEALAPYISQRVYLQFEHEPEPAGYRLLRLMRRTFLEYFSV